MTKSTTTRNRRLVAAAVRTLAGTLGLVVTASAASAAVSAPAAPTPTVTPIATKLVSPLSVAQAPDGTRYWTDDAASLLYKQSPGGQATVAYTGTKKGGVESVSADGGRLRFTTGSKDNSAGKLMTLDTAGAPVQLADLYAYEKQSNPDKTFKYGFQNVSKQCRELLRDDYPGQPTKAVVESHPYATATDAAGVTYVADAGANAIFAVSTTGVVSTAAALKPVTVKITKRIQQGIADLPPCLLGKKVTFESVPTDIEIGPDGMLYVTSFGGAPEDGSYGDVSRLMKVDPLSGKVTTIGKRYQSLTGVAVAPNGDLYLADLFAGAILTIPAGKTNPTTFADVPLPAAVEYTAGGVLATINAIPGKKPKGQVVTIAP